jgi:hypothetical protein
MAIAPSKLGRLVAQEWPSDQALLRRLRETGLVTEDTPDGDLRATFLKAREEHAALSLGDRPFNSPNERVRVFLAPYLSKKGRAWAVPLKSLELPEDDVRSPSPARSPWWKVWR